MVVNLNVELNGKTYTARTDSNSQITVSTADLAPEHALQQYPRKEAETIKRQVQQQTL